MIETTLATAMPKNNDLYADDRAMVGSLSPNWNATCISAVSPMPSVNV
jgi:hypothetical protein